MILVDTSAWIEYQRATGSSVDLWLNAAVEADEPLATVGIVTMELLAGARDDIHLGQLRRFLARWKFLPLEEPSDYELAASVYRECRRRGHTIRRQADCLIAAIAMRSGTALVHRDTDFDSIASAVPLQLVQV